MHAQALAMVTAERDSLRAQLKASKLTCQIAKSTSMRRSGITSLGTGARGTLASATSTALGTAAAHVALEQAVAALEAELDIMRAPRVTLAPGSDLTQRLAAALQRLRAWTRHCVAPARADETMEVLWRRLREAEVKHEAVCGLLQRAKSETAGLQAQMRS